MRIGVEVFTNPSCPRCAGTREALSQLVAEFGAAHVTVREVDVIEAIDRAVAMGVLSTPAVFVDGRRVPGAPPSKARLRRAIAERLRRAGGRSVKAGAD